MTDTPEPEQPIAALTAESSRDRFTLTLILVVIAFGLVVIALALTSLPFRSPARLWDIDDSGGNATDQQIEALRSQAEAQASYALAQYLNVIALLVAAIGGLLFYRETKKQVALAEGPRSEIQKFPSMALANDRFALAVELLGAVRPDGQIAEETRIGGIYGLEKLAHDYSDEYYALVMEVLTTYVREHAPASRAVDLAPGVDIPKPSIDIQAILMVIGRRDQKLLDRTDVTINLRRTNLQRGYVCGAHLPGVDLMCARLECAQLMFAHMEGAQLSCAHLEDADLCGARLEGAYLTDAHLEGTYLLDAVLNDAHLRNADLRFANMNEASLTRAHLEYAHLEGADLRSAGLEGAVMWSAYLGSVDVRNAYLTSADMRYADLEGTDLSNSHLERSVLSRAYLARAVLSHSNLDCANLRGANLYDVVGLTQEQIDQTYMDERTQLPDGLTCSTKGHPAEAVE